MNTQPTSTLPAALPRTKAHVSSANFSPLSGAAGPTLEILTGDNRETLRGLPDESVHCCVTSPPYYGLRDYGVAGQIGQEETPSAFVAELVAVFREVRRVLREDGTLWLNLGDSYAGSWGAQSRGGPPSSSSTLCGNGHIGGGPKISALSRVQVQAAPKSTNTGTIREEGLKPKDLIGIPWRVAFALQADGWFLRQDIIWHKPNPMPESVTDRCTKAHEYIFLLSKSARYFYDQEAILEPVSAGTHARLSQNIQDQIGGTRANGGAKTNGNMKAVGRGSWKGSEFCTGKTAEHQLGRASTNRKFDDGAGNKNNPSFDAAMAIMPEVRNKRSVWTVPTQSYRGAHFATFPEDLIKPCILAGCPVGGTVLDPFGGSGTTGAVSLELGRSAVLCELNPAYVGLIRERCAITPGLALGSNVEVIDGKGANK